MPSAGEYGRPLIGLFATRPMHNCPCMCLPIQWLGRRTPSNTVGTDLYVYTFLPFAFLKWILLRVDFSEPLHDLGSSSLTLERMVCQPSFSSAGLPSQAFNALELASSTSHIEVLQVWSH